MVHRGGKGIRKWCKKFALGGKKFALGGPAGGRQDNQSSAHFFAIDWTICFQNGPAGPSAALVPYLI